MGINHSRPTSGLVGMGTRLWDVGFRVIRSPFRAFSVTLSLSERFFDEMSRDCDRPGDSHSSKFDFPAARYSISNFRRTDMSFTTPTYLAVKTATSRSLDHSKRRVISLYRQWQRAVHIPLSIDELTYPRPPKSLKPTPSSSPSRQSDHESVKNLNDIDMCKSYPSLMFSYSRALQSIRYHHRIDWTTRANLGDRRR
jgi:hypothetical protein